MCSIFIFFFNGDKLPHLSFSYILVANGNVVMSPDRKVPPKYAQDWPFSLATNCPNSLFHWRQNVPTTFHNFHVHKCISWDILSPGRKWDILSDGTICRPKNASWTMVFLYICQRYGQKLPKIYPRYARDTRKLCPRCGDSNWESGTKCRRGGCISWDIMSPGRCIMQWDILSLGHFVS